VSELKIHEAIAKVGHSTEKVVADKAVYDKLPSCCQYQDRECKKKGE
jgi:hypothetical protein